MAETVDLGYVKGPTGDTGPTGPTGPVGPTGPANLYIVDDLPDESEVKNRPAVVVTKNGGVYRLD